MSKETHTPTPWLHVADHNFECRHLIRLDPDEPGTAEAIGQIIDPVNAAFIVVAVNQHDALYEAVRKAIQLASIASDWNLGEVEIDGKMVETDDLREEFEAAFSKAAGVK